MEHLRLKSLWATIGAPGSPFAGWCISVEVADRWLSVAIKLLGCIGGVASLLWMWRLNRLEQAHKIAVACDDCEKGHPPEVCPLPPKRRPKNCPRP